MIKEGASVRLTKIEGATPPREGDPTNIGYTVEGWLTNTLVVGGAIKIWRYMRNGTRVTGLFTSSPIRAFDGDKILTTNSIWKIEVIP